MIKRLVFIGFKYPHHGRHAGYDLIADYLPYDLVLHAEKLWFFRFLHAVGHRQKPLMIGRFTLMDPLNVFYKVFTAFAFLRCLFMRNTCFHFCYPETGVLFIRNVFTSSNRFVATIHLPDTGLKHLPRHILKKLNRMQHLILLSNESLENFPFIPSTFIPHGVDTDYYKPGQERNADVDILMLGNWMRDFDLAANIFAQLENLDKSYKIKVVALKENLKSFSGLSHVECLSEISDEKLLSLLQRTRILFLPLKGLSASNALLEAAACGCRICLSLPESVNPSYFPDYIQKIDPAPNVAAKELHDILQNEWNDEEIAAHTHQHYGWEKIAVRVKTLLLSSG